MKQTLSQFKGKRVRVYTISGVESYVGVVQDVTDEALALKEAGKGETMYVALPTIEAVHLQEQAAG